jgi:carbon storage regulator
MLVLARKLGESIVIGDNIKIHVLSIGSGRVKIGIEAPSQVVVDREEVSDLRQPGHSDGFPTSPSQP